MLFCSCCSCSSAHICYPGYLYSQRPVRPNSFHLFYPAMRCSYRSSQSPNLRGYCRLSVGQFNATTRTQSSWLVAIFLWYFLTLFFLTSYSRPLLSSPLRSAPVVRKKFIFCIVKVNHTNTPRQTGQEMHTKCHGWGTSPHIYGTPLWVLSSHVGDQNRPVLADSQSVRLCV